VPDVTAACAAVARFGRSLTERGVADTLVLTTGTGGPDAPLPEDARMSGPGTTSGFCMAVRQAERLAARLMAQGLPADAPVDFAVDVSKPQEGLIASTLAALADDLKWHDVTGCAVLLITRPKSALGAETRLPVVPLEVVAS
jgi:uroporphyrin-III C-methyltransferase/precorrin-2 dehydrogenase/sirohydrochlorin ferrochelatase